jgi:hypothetical protein
MDKMFCDTPFNQQINNWDVRSVKIKTLPNELERTTFISSIFGDLEDPSRFSYNCPLTKENKPKWGKKNYFE